MYTRYWSVPNDDYRFGLMFATYHPKIVLDAMSTKEDARNHRNHWNHYVIFFHLQGTDASPYACAWHKTDGTITGIPWAWCLQNPVNQRPNVLITLDGLKVGNSVHVLDDQFRGTFNLAAWEFLHIGEIDNFNGVDWTPAQCLMQDKNFDIEMKGFLAATEQYA